MSIIATILASITSLIALTWAIRHVAFCWVGRTGLSLSDDSPGPPADAPRVSVLVPAKDEQENIGPCLRSLLRQDYPDFEVIVVDDRSADGTGEVVGQIAAEDDRVRLITIDELPDGWCGKNHAVWTAVQEATGTWLVTIDADCRQTSNRGLSVAVADALAHDADLLSVLPTLIMEGFWENVVQPVCSAVLIYWFQPDKVNNPTSGPAYANGAFMLFRREAYEAVGGHEAIRGEMMEDLRLAAKIKESGRRLRVVQNEGLYEVRMYTSVGEMIDGWSRIFFGAFTTRRKLRASMIVLGVLSLLPYVVVALGFGLWSAGADGPWREAAIAGVVAAALQISMIGRLYRVLKARWTLCWTWPIGCVVAMAVLWRAYRLHRPGSSLTWRDTTYTTGAGN